MVEIGDGYSDGKADSVINSMMMSEYEYVLMG